MGCGDGELGGKIGVHFAIGRVLGRPQPAHAHAHIVAIGGAGRYQARGLGRAQTHARARTRRVRAAARSCGNGKEAIKRLPGFIPGEVVPWNPEVTAVEAGQECRAINDARCGI
jgi:hypothetical protein